MRCDVIAEGIIKATKELQLEIPLIVRLQGTKEAEAKKCVAFVSLCGDIANSQDDQGVWLEDLPIRWTRRGCVEGCRDGQERLSGWMMLEGYM
jgi:hypothetical protein